ncbi:hypothetical protein NA57DRAFT_46183 [Rhizodiscina lignyota]|uniref:C2H2-type domain-containing protein n=1 Tax=Rhizodiscina lignyota TaxID=1504668 RepID=A0A9P4M2K4_9PEZI|nr:hypothetical protein NA57DRAFT_46183 [Rhizodiscina lignyota]
MRTEPSVRDESTPESTLHGSISASRQSTFTPTPLHNGESPAPQQPSLCHWVLNPLDPPSQQQLCSFTAASADDLHNHILRAHTQHLNATKGFVCHWHGCPRFASASYGQKSKLNRHVQTHSHFLPYACSFTGTPYFCTKRFSTNDQRRNHEATHTDDRKYQCSVCGARFKHATSLSTHKFTHTGEKPYKCWICGKAEGDPSNRSKHVKKEHPGWPRVRPTDWDDARVEQERQLRGMTGVKES